MRRANLEVTDLAKIEAILEKAEYACLGINTGGANGEDGVADANGADGTDDVNGANGSDGAGADSVDGANGVNGDDSTAGAPYVLPVSFGYTFNGSALTLYFHCATVGKKLDLIAENSRVGVMVALSNGYVETAHVLTSDYNSVIGAGRCSALVGEERVEGLRALLQHCGFPEYSAEECAALPAVAVYKVELDWYTAKSKF